MFSDILCKKASLDRGLFLLFSTASLEAELHEEIYLQHGNSEQAGSLQRFVFFLTNSTSLFKVKV